MEQVNTGLKFAGHAGSLMAIVGLLAYLAGIFSMVPRMFVFVGVGLFALALTAFVIEEFGPRR